MHEQADATRSSRLRGHIRSNLVGYLALVVALSMTPGYASHLVVRTSDIVKGAVTTPKLRNGAVGTLKMKNGAVKRPKIFAGAVGTDEIEDGMVTAPKLANLAVTSTKLGNFAVTGSKLGTSSVSAAKLANSAVTTDKLAGLAVTHSKLANLAVGNAKLGHSSVTASKLAGIIEVTANSPTVGNGIFHLATANCPAGTRVIGGGWSSAQWFVTTSRREGNGWRAEGINQGGLSALTARAYCLSA